MSFLDTGKTLSKPSSYVKPRLILSAKSKHQFSVCLALTMNSAA